MEDGRGVLVAAGVEVAVVGGVVGVFSLWATDGILVAMVVGAIGGSALADEASKGTQALCRNKSRMEKWR